MAKPTKRASHGKQHKRLRGTHKRATSPETLRWDAEHLIPTRPEWMPVETYTALADLRRNL